MTKPERQKSEAEGLGRARHSVRAGASSYRMRRARSDAPHRSSILVSALLDWFSKNARDLPWRKTSDSYAVWISEIMLQQTQVKTVIPYWERWMRELPTIESFAAAKTEKILKLWEGLGYYTRVHNAQKAARIVVGKFGGEFPKTFSDVLSLPGIGRYTAGAICSIAFNQPTPILDGNVIRVLTRIFGIAEDPREKSTNARLWEIAEELVSQASLQKTERVQSVKTPSPPLKMEERVGERRLVARGERKQNNSCSHLNQSLMELGALICTPRQPKCLLCPLKKPCIAHRENRVEELPNLAPRISATQRRFVAFVVKRKDLFLIRQRPGGVVNAHLWEFPNVEVAPDAKRISALPFELAKNAEPFCTVKHSITRYRITLEAFPASLPTDANAQNATEVWKPLAELEQLAFTSAHRKILKAISRDSVTFS